MSEAVDRNPIPALPIPERKAIVERINASIAEDTDSTGLTEEQKRELDRRLEEFRKNPESGLSWEQVEHAALTRWRKT